MFGQGGRRIRLAFCSQLLCVVPYEFTRARGLFAAEGLDVELVYTRGGNAARQALVGGAVEYAATSFDVALLAFANGAQIRRFATTGRLPLFALASAPARAAQLIDIADLEGATIGVSALGNADHVLALYLRGPYEFMGVAVRADELDARLEEMRALARALEAGLIALQSAPVEELVAALPPALIAGDDEERLLAILERTRRSLYPDTVNIDRDSSRRVEESQRIAGVREAEVDLDVLLATHVLDPSGS